MKYGDFNSTYNLLGEQCLALHVRADVGFRIYKVLIERPRYYLTEILKKSHLQKS